MHTASEAHAKNKPIVPPIKDPGRYETKIQTAGKFTNVIMVEKEKFAKKSGS